MEVCPDHIPLELQALDSFLLWENFNRGDRKLSKSPVLSAGVKASYNAAEALMSFESAKEKLSKAKDLGLGISLLDGIKVNVEPHTGYLWCLDFDGFADPVTDNVDDYVRAFLETFPSYAEISPSGTGFKYFFVCDRPPQSKSKIKFGPSEFADIYPDVTKYGNREVEVFSCSFFLALTGQVFSPSTEEIKFLSCAEFEAILEQLHSWAKSTGGSGTTASSTPGQASVSTATSASYSKLTKSSLVAVLTCVDHVDEQIWSDTANVLARVYGEEGRHYFLSYSEGVYSQVAYPRFDLKECSDRFTRALYELEYRPDGYGITYLIETAKSHAGWSSRRLEYEADNPFKKSEPNELEITSKANNIVIADLKDPSLEEVADSYIDQLRRYSITGQSEELKKRLLNDVFIMDRIAILGQWTAIYAAPNTGKTLLTLWMLREQITNGLVEAKNVFYINADDHYRGMTEKVEIAESFDMGMFAPNFKEFTVDKTLPIMHKLAASGEARGTVIVLDTLKKFTDLMDKRTSSGFGRVAREFVAAGGSLIVLAHTNKHNGADGKGIYSGTSDIVDDADCVFIIDKVGECEEFAGKKITVEFSNKKSRGDVASTLGFTYSKGGQSYLDLLDSVKRVDEKGLEGAKLETEQKKQLDIDGGIIKAASQAIKTGINTKAALIEEIKRGTAESTASVRRIIEARTGNDYAQGHRWVVTAGEHNAKIFSVLPTL